MATINKGGVEELKKLYEVERRSAPEIATILGYSLDAVYYAMRRYKIIRRSPTQNSQILFDRKPLSYKLLTTFSAQEEKLKLSGVLLYWCEGYKTQKSKIVDFANSDKEMVLTFLNFLRVVCGVDESRLRVLIYCHSNSNPQKLISFWSKFLHIPKSQFTKPYVQVGKLEKKSKMPYGLVHIRYADKKLLRQILTWIEEYKAQLSVGGRAVKYTGL